MPSKDITAEAMNHDVGVGADFRDDKCREAFETTDDELGTTARPGDRKPDSSEYPSGVRLLIIVVAVVLSIFLMSLDQVRVLSTI